MFSTTPSMRASTARRRVARRARPSDAAARRPASSRLDPRARLTPVRRPREVSRAPRENEPAVTVHLLEVASASTPRDARARRAMELSMRFRNFGLRARVRFGTGRRATRARTVLPTRERAEMTARDADASARDFIARAASGDERTTVDADADDARDAVTRGTADDGGETVRMSYEVLVRATDARRAWSVIQPLICPRDAREAKMCVDAMSAIVECDVVDGERVTGAVVRQKSKWRHGALISGTSVTTTAIETDAENLRATFDVDTESGDERVSTLRRYRGSTDVRQVDDDKLAIRMRGEARIARASGFTGKLIRDVMLGAMRSQMKSSLVDLGRALGSGESVSA